MGGTRVLVRERRALCRIWRLNTGKTLLCNQQRPSLSNGREQKGKSGAEGWAFGHPSLAVVAWCPSVQQKAGFDMRGTSVADSAVEQRLRLSKILSKESVSTKWKQLHRCPYKLARTTLRQAWWLMLWSQDLGGWVGLPSHQRQFGLWDPVSNREKWTAVILF